MNTVKQFFTTALLASTSLGAYAQSVNNEVFIEQVGKTNQANVEVGVGVDATAYDNLADVYQEGEDNLAYIAQGKNPSFAEDNEAAISQKGTDNSASISQGKWSR